MYRRLAAVAVDPESPRHPVRGRGKLLIEVLGVISQRETTLTAIKPPFWIVSGFSSLAWSPAVTRIKAPPPMPRRTSACFTLARRPRRFSSFSISSIVGLSACQSRHFCVRSAAGRVMTFRSMPDDM
ncbi:hypothetical protein ADT71_08715 [Novosphingobium sp. ST904]|nr:hypothetical protein ADT71_08715 [Novosphingobium sp. ST904]